MTTVTIDDALATRLRALGDKNDDIDALAEGIRRREREAASRAEMQAMLDGPRYTLAESHARLRLKYDIPSLAHLTRDEREAEVERIIAAMAPSAREKMERKGLL